MVIPRRLESRAIVSQRRFHNVRTGKIFHLTKEFPIAITSEHAQSMRPADIERSSLLNWEEHCVECAAPACHSTCDLFMENEAGRCRRFLFGIEPTRRF